jgi:excisionase family DNA binding protein
LPNEFSPFDPSGGPLEAVKASPSHRANGQGKTALLDIAALAERLAVSERYIRRLVFERRIPFLKIGHFIRFDPAEIDGWIAQARVPVETPH